VTVRISDVDDNRPNFETSGSNDFFIPTGVREGNFILGVSGKNNGVGIFDAIDANVASTYSKFAATLRKVWQIGIRQISKMLII